MMPAPGEERARVVASRGLCRKVPRLSLDLRDAYARVLTGASVSYHPFGAWVVKIVLLLYVLQEWGVGAYFVIQQASFVIKKGIISYPNSILYIGGST